MNKEKFMQFISEAIDNGAKIELLFYGTDEHKQKAEQRIKEFSEIVGGAHIAEKTSETHKWLVADVPSKVYMSHFYDHDYLEEDVDLTGGEEIA
jgi:hypothetical protein